MNPKVAFYVCSTAAMSLLALLASLSSFHKLGNLYVSTAFLVVGILASMFRLRIPAIEGTYSLNFVVLLAAAPQLAVGEVLSLAAICALVQSYRGAARQPRKEQVIFNVSNLILSAGCAFAVSRLLTPVPGFLAPAIALLAGAAYYMINTGLTAIVLCLSHEQSLSQVWNHWAAYTLPVYLVGSIVAALWTYALGPTRAPVLILVVAFLYCLHRIFAKLVSLASQVDRTP